MQHNILVKTIAKEQRKKRLLKRDYINHEIHYRIDNDAVVFHKIITMVSTQIDNKNMFKIR